MLNPPLFLPRLTVVGAGPGDPELLTLKGARVLAAADVVLYDALANDALLAHARPGTELVFVGKRLGFKAYAQEEINELIVRWAYRRGHVVRLKGGDPFVFGRGREEMLHAEAHGLATEYVPGISSAVAAAGSLGIPPTHRGPERRLPGADRHQCRRAAGGRAARSGPLAAHHHHYPDGPEPLS